MKQWMIYGATGYNGELIARKAASLGLKPTLAGRSVEKITRLANELNLSYEVFGLQDDFHHRLADYNLVLHCAGPYSTTAAPMIEACLASRAHYLDITGEIDTFENNFNTYHNQAEVQHVLLVSGVGFDVVPTDCLANMLKAQLPDATKLELAFDAALIPGKSAAFSMIEGLKSGNRIRHHGQLMQVPMAYRFKEIDFAGNIKPAMSIPWGDVTTAYHSTGIGNIIVYMALPVSMEFMKPLINLSEHLMAHELTQSILKKLADTFINGEEQKHRSASSAMIWGRVKNKAGQEKTMCLQVPHPIEHTADCALAATQAVLKLENTAGGAASPAMLFGADFVKSVEGVKVISNKTDLPRM